MPFDVARFNSTDMKPRTDVVAVPDMKEFFGPGEKAEWIVRGLTGQELGQAKAAAGNRKNVAVIISSLLSGNAEEQGEALKKLLNIGEDVSYDTALRIFIFRLGSVDPVIDEETAVKICTTFPIEFSTISDRIYKLTGLGHEPGKANASFGTPPLEAH